MLSLSNYGGHAFNTQFLTCNYVSAAASRSPGNGRFNQSR